MELANTMWQFGADAGSLEQGVLDRARRGEQQALAELYRRHAGSAYTLALRITGRTDRAEDVVQDAFLRAFERLADFRGEAPFGAWLRRVVVNLAIDRLRGERRLDDDATTIERLAAPETDHARQLDALGLLQRLSAAARSVLVLHDLEGYSHADIAAAFGHSESWSKTVLSRTRARLRAWQAGTEHDDE
jgi:RNA polymerase sigma-70 factor, ECF subfamily